MSLHNEVLVPLTFDPASILEFKEKFTSALHEVKCQVIVLIGHDNYFSQGLNLNYVIANDTKAFLSLCAAAFELVKMSAKPVIAKVTGHVVAGGMIWLGLADVVVATRESTFCLPEATFDLFPYLVTASLMERLRPHELKRMILTVQAYTAENAVNLGLVDEVVVAEQMDEKIASYVTKLSRISTAMMQELKTFIDMKYQFSQFLLAGAAKLQEQLTSPEIVSNIKDRLAVINMLTNE